MQNPPARSWTCLMMSVLSPLDPQSKAVVGVQTWPPCSSSGFSELLYCLTRYKDNPFSLGESFSSRWDTDTAWGMDRMEEKEPEVTVSSIRPISERWSGQGQHCPVGFFCGDGNSVPALSSVMTTDCVPTELLRCGHYN